MSKKCCKKGDVSVTKKIVYNNIFEDTVNSNKLQCQAKYY